MIADTKAAIDVLTERKRQINAEGYTAQSDDVYGMGELISAAICYADHANSRGWVVGSSLDDYAKEPVPYDWPWIEKYWKPTTPRHDLVKAAALILAEIERIDRKELTQD